VSLIKDIFYFSFFCIIFISFIELLFLMDLTPLDKNKKEYSNNDDEPKDEGSLKDNQDEYRGKEEHDSSSTVPAEE
jgi:hypothetical protein